MGFHRRFFCALRRALPYLNPCKTTLAMRLFRLTLLVLLFFAQNVASGQISDDFSDGDFTQNPTWLGDAANFKVTGGELQLNATAAGQSVLVTSGNIADSTVWNLRFRLTFAPSAQNLLRIYLLADQANLAAANGYFLEIGENGSADALRLFRQDGTTAKTLLATGQPGLVAANPDIQLRVKRKKSGDWEIYAATFGSALQPQLSVTDATYSGGPDRYFGFQCVYTVTNVARFFFDNISILPDVPDTKPPVLMSAQADDATHVTAFFDETLDSLSAVDPANYTLSAGIGQPLAASLLSGKNAVSLTLAAPLTTGSFTLQTTAVKDVSGNVSTAQTTDFQFVKIESATGFDLLINEIMADPTPSVGLPEVEWLEIYNRSAKTIDLATLRIAEGNNPAVALPAYLMSPNTYAVLAAPANVSALRPVSADTVLAVSLSSTALNNDGDLLTLSTVGGLTVDQVEYRADWHTDSGKADGGWTLERVSAQTRCAGRGNWRSGAGALGGTPGRANAAVDVAAPQLLSARTESPTVIRVLFSEVVDPQVSQTQASYQISPARLIASANLLPNDTPGVRLTLAEPLLPSTPYTLTVGPTVSDCSGNLLAGPNSAPLFLADAAAEADIVINEIMADPTPSAGLPEVEWLELYNRSTKTIDLASLRIIEGSGAGGTLPTYLMRPNTYVVLAAPANVAALRLVSADTVLVAPFSASALNDGGELITLSTTAGLTVNRVNYRPDWHTDPGKDGGGWSLERINPQLPCLGRVNWRSCPALPGGTPGKVNASFSLAPDMEAPQLLYVFPESPTEISLHFSEGLDGAAVADLSAYDLSPSRAIASAGLYPGERAAVRLLLAEPLAKQTVYALTVEAPVADCSGNLFEGRDTVLIGLPEKPAPQDIVVNEVMFNPAPNGSRYVEFFNRSPKVFDWSEFFIAGSGSVATAQVRQRRLSVPGQYDVFAPDPMDVAARFDRISLRNLVEQVLPSMDDKAGQVWLYWTKNGQTVVLDSFDYSEDFHNALFNISEREGMALERIRASGPTNSPSNWTSAAPNLTGAPGSPTLANSQRLDGLRAGADDSLIELPSPARLSPDDDGREDFLDIRYSLPREGYAATMTIFDAEGIPLRRLARQQLIGTEGALRWDGDLDDGTKARPGIYVLFLEIFSPTGEVRREKRAVTVVSKW